MCILANCFTSGRASAGVGGGEEREGRAWYFQVVTLFCFAKLGVLLQCTDGTGYEQQVMYQNGKAEKYLFRCSTDERHKLFCSLHTLMYGDPPYRRHTNNATRRGISRLLDYIPFSVVCR